MSEYNKQVIFEFLDIVRESGAINMFEGARLIQDQYGLSKQDARDILLEWMQAFTKKHSVAK